MDKYAMILAFSELGLEIAEKIAWLFKREGTEFTEAEKAQINAELAAARQRFLDTLARAAT